MAIIQLQGEQEKKLGIYYEFDDTSRPLGEGGMGKVFRGRRKNIHTKETRDVAIKFIFSGLPPNVIKRARDEASIHIIHDNLVEMMGFLAVETTSPGRAVTVRYHVVSELLIGVSLSELLKGNVTDQDGNRIPYAEELYSLYTTDRTKFAVTVMKKVLSGIMALHDAGYIHRDIDPSNIMVTRDGKIKIIDFGICKKVDGLHTTDRNLTVDGQFMGKPQYAAPELILGELKNQNKPTDIYALGVLFYQLLTGKLPFEGPSNIVLKAHLHTNLPVRNIHNRELRKIVKRATEKDCFERYNTAAEFRAALDMAGHIKTPWYRTPGGMGGICGGLALVIVALIFIFSAPHGCSKSGTGTVLVDTPKIDVVIEPTLGKALDMLDSPETAPEGFRMLKDLADAKDPEAMYVMSRIYAQSNKVNTLEGEIITYQNNLKGTVSPNIVTAHQLLNEVVKVNPKDYRALYDLACDHYHYRDSDGIPRNFVLSKQYLDKAAKYAAENNDVVYQDKINVMLDNF